MNEKLAKAYELLSRIPVTGDAVEAMAAVRALLRDVYKEVTDNGRQSYSGSSED